MEKVKKEINDILQKSVGFAINDNRTFLKAKSSGSAVGGGNFSITLYSFAIINLLARTFAVLADGKKGTDKNAFVKLCFETNFMKWGFETQAEAGSVWNLFRDSLSHLATPREAAASEDFTDGKKYEDYLKELSESNENIYDFHCQDNSKCIYAELLSERLPKLLNFVMAHIDECTDIDRLNCVKLKIIDLK